MIKDLDTAYKVLASFALLLLGTIILIQIFGSQNWEIIYKLLVPLGVLVSALLASVSVMKSIENSKIIEKEKEERNII